MAPMAARLNQGGCRDDVTASSPILTIANDVARARAAGASIVDCSVGDFDPRTFPPPRTLTAGVARALRGGYTTYGPPAGLHALREAVARSCKRELGMPSVHPDDVVVAAGARPLIYAVFRTVLAPGDTVLCPVPSWNNDAFARLARARVVPVATSAATGFFPTATQLRPHLDRASLLVLCSPLNPTGTMIDSALLGRIARLVVEENCRRHRGGGRPLYLLFDQVYWRLLLDRSRWTHETPAGRVPAVAPFTVVVDAASKAFAATGLRVGYAVVPEALRARIVSLIGHMGAWAPTAEQMAVADLLGRPDELAAAATRMNTELQRRVRWVSRALRRLARPRGELQVLTPQAGIYVAVRVKRSGWSDEAARVALLEAGVAVVPFTAFGLDHDSGWLRLCVAGAPWRALRTAPGRIARALERVSPA